ncbi:UNVERIFIED_CONTAM: hypothetical protein Sradi_6465900 [Sesamum radiatum]|uniref:Uncharacterized protein n=1 Tax=Sesamum radiatum TaxID=300843 RepID=A0AAW2K545_SESRA
MRLKVGAQLPCRHYQGQCKFLDRGILRLSSLQYLTDTINSFVNKGGLEAFFVP